MEQIKQNLKAWTEGKRWVNEIEKRIFEEGAFDPSRLDCSKTSIIDICANFNLLKDFEKKNIKEHEKQMADILRQKIFIHLKKVLCTEEFLNIEGYIDFPIVYKQWSTIYGGSIKSNSENQISKTKKVYKDYTNCEHD
jgi:hypothetical protein